MRPSSTAVVEGFPRSWHKAPSMMATRRGRSRSSLAARARSHHHERVNPHVSLGVPLRLLWTIHEWPQFRQDLIHDSEVERQGQPKRGRSAGATASRLHPRSARRASRRAARRDTPQRLPHPGRSRIGRQLDGPQHAQTVVSERLQIHCSQHPLFEVSATVKGIFVRIAERVPGDAFTVKSVCGPPRRSRAMGSPRRQSPCVRGPASTRVAEEPRQWRHGAAAREPPCTRENCDRRARHGRKRRGSPASARPRCRKFLDRGQRTADLATDLGPSLPRPALGRQRLSHPRQCGLLRRGWRRRRARWSWVHPVSGCSWEGGCSR